MVLRRRRCCVHAPDKNSMTVPLLVLLLGLTCSSLVRKSLPPAAAAATAVSETAAPTTATDYFYLPDTVADDVSKSTTDEINNKSTADENYYHSLLPCATTLLPGGGAWLSNGQPCSTHGKEKDKKVPFREKKISNFEIYIQEAERLMRSLVPTSSPEVPGPLLLTPADLQMMTNASKFQFPRRHHAGDAEDPAEQDSEDREEHDEGHAKSKELEYSRRLFLKHAQYGNTYEYKVDSFTKNFVRNGGSFISKRQSRATGTPTIRI